MYRSTFLILLCFAWATAYDDVAIQKPISVISRAREVCSKGGYSCSEDCSTVVLCIEQGDDTYTQIDVQSCTEPELCSLRNGNCSSTELSCKAAAQPFHCTGPGYFPDPYDCIQYHVCVKDNGVSADRSCDGWWGYDSRTTACGLLLTSQSCVDDRFPQCTHAGQTGADRDNPSIYYVCVQNAESGALEYWLYRCEYGWNYNSSTYACEPTDAATTQIPTSTSSGETTTTQRPEIGRNCDSPGMYADEGNCHRYFICTPDHIWEYYSCYEGFHYNAVQEQCVLGSC